MHEDAVIVSMARIYKYHGRDGLGEFLDTLTVVAVALFAAIRFRAGGDSAIADEKGRPGMYWAAHASPMAKERPSSTPAMYLLIASSEDDFRPATIAASIAMADCSASPR